MSNGERKTMNRNVLSLTFSDGQGKGVLIIKKVVMEVNGILYKNHKRVFCQSEQIQPYTCSMINVPAKVILP